MAKRIPLTKKTRFEVFKRDSFTCQYCGAKAPDVVLEVDHIIPVKEGGTNDILNLITSCKACNSGKSCRKLSDDSVIVKRQKQAAELQEREEMITMMAEWQHQLLSEQDKQIDMLEELFKSYYPDLSFTEFGRRDIRKQIKQFGFRHVHNCLEIALNQYDNPRESLNKLGGICYNRRKGGEG